MATKNVKISDLSERGRGHLAWRLDHKTGCGLLTACRIAKLEFGDMNLVEVFEKFGGCSKHSAIMHAKLTVGGGITRPLGNLT